MYSLKEYVKYFETLCRQHVDIKHTDRTPRLFRMKPRDVTTKLEKADGVICVLESPEFFYSDNQANNYMKEKTAAFSILKRADPDNFVEQDDVVDECEIIAEDIIARIKDDNRDYDDQKFGIINLNTFSGFKVGPVYDRFYGVRIEFKFGDSISMCVNENKWNFNLGV